MKSNILTIIKYLFSIIIIIYSSFFYGTISYLLFGVVELSIIFLISNLVLSKKKIIGLIVNDILLLLLNINYCVLIFGNSYVSSIMLSNLSSIPALGGSLIKYGIALLVLIAISFIPIRSYYIKRFSIVFPIICIISYIVLFNVYSYKYSSYGSYFMLIRGYISEYKMQLKLKSTNGNKDLFARESNNLNDKYKVDGKPNIILIFTEGLSLNIVEDSRNIMPNTKKYMNQSLRFGNYYNHTAATYRGLIGQLFSGYQYENTDENLLISMEDILRDNGYYTEFINVENNNKEFTDYLKTLHFDDVVTNNYNDEVLDEEAYNYLFDEAIRLNEEDKPFFISIYTFQTHVGWDSDNKFGDGKSNVLNRFHNNDDQFGKFMNKFIKSKLYDNTIIVYTSDHATYSDADFYSAFKDYNRECTFLDKIPFFIYHKNVTSEVIDVNGRNSLDMAPTVLDYIDISGKNYFLGDSLFDENNSSKYDHYFCANPGEYYSSFDSKIKVEPGNKFFESALIDYYSISRKK